MSSGSTESVDLNFESKWDDWIRAGKPEGKNPAKHRYVTGYHRGLELYDGHAPRLQEPWVKESLDGYGVVIVEGMNDVNAMKSKLPGLELSPQPTYIISEHRTEGRN